MSVDNRLVTDGLEIAMRTGGQTDSHGIESIEEDDERMRNFRPRSPS